MLMYPIHGLRNRCEDALNIIRGTCIIDKSVFKGTFSDAFDGDFIKGEITNSNFISCLTVLIFLVVSLISKI